MEICSIGSSGNSAERFFGLLRTEKVTSIVDTRIHASSQLAGFTRKESLIYFSKELLGIPYFHELLLAPEDLDLKAYRNGAMSWEDYEAKYEQLLITREVTNRLDMSQWGSRPVFLCSENIAEKCHRRLAAEYLKNHSMGIEAIKHL